MSHQAKFDKAVAIVQGLPAEGPVQPSSDDKLKARIRKRREGLVIDCRSHTSCSSTLTISKLILGMLTQRVLVYSILLERRNGMRGRRQVFFYMR